MRIDAAFKNVEKNLEEHAPFFIRRVAPALVVFSFLFSLMLADCMNMSLLFGLQMGLLFVPVAYFMGVFFVLLGRGYVELLRPAVLPISIVSMKFLAHYSFSPSFFSPVPISPPRLCLADREAIQPQG